MESVGFYIPFLFLSITFLVASFQFFSLAPIISQDYLGKTFPFYPASLTYLNIFFLGIAAFRSPLEVALLLPMIPFVLLACEIDYRVYLLPNILLLRALAWSLPGIFYLMFRGEYSLLGFSLLGSLIAALFFLISMHLGVGAGDTKFAPLIFFWAIVSKVFISYLFTLCFAPAIFICIRGLIFQRFPRNIAYGPWILFALLFSLAIA
ncbi:hypothetical protein KRX54_04450 [Actinomycetaceae bacterium TAE3-ERU4]|nr:hypothetical protein [Actinomycetaceae bacterium TAE3-ERU4]